MTALADDGSFGGIAAAYAEAVHMELLILQVLSLLQKMRVSVLMQLFQQIQKKQDQRMLLYYSRCKMGNIISVVTGTISGVVSNIFSGLSSSQPIPPPNSCLQ